jgi:hypothetical protein
MAYLIGVCLGLAVGLAGTLVGFERDRAWYAAVLIVVGHYYVLFAAIGGGGSVLAVETAILAGFFALAAAGFRRSLWLLVAGLAAHGVLDSVHGRLIANRGVPVWWPAFCAAFDVSAAGYLAWRLAGRKIPVRGPGPLPG